MAREFDCVVFGATGFTGKRVVEEMARVAGNHSWAIAGRTESKLKSVLDEAGQTVGQNLSNIPTIVADVSDEKSLEEMAKRCKIVLNCVGPYRLYGEAVVKACVENATHHVDVSGEPIYLEKMALNYGEKAAEKGIYVVGSCGWDSIPFDLGCVFTAQQFPGELNYIEGIFQPKSAPGYAINTGTFESMIYGFANRHELGPIRKALMKERLPRSQFKMPKRKTFFQHEGTGGWCVPFLGSDRSVGQRTQHYLYHQEKKRPIQQQAFFQMSSYFMGILGIVWGMFFGLMCNWEFTRNLMRKYPEIFSFGMFSSKGPTRQQMENSSFSYKFFGHGWKSVLGAGQEHDEPTAYGIETRVDGPEMGYLSTSIFLVTSALTILEDQKDLPSKGGVYTPGVAFGNTSMIDRLTKRGVTFKVIANDLKN